jgi:hypothetical protein
MTRQHARYRAHGVGSALHYIASAGAVNMYVDKAGNGRQVFRVHFLRAGRQTHALSRADGFDHTFANQNSHVWDFSCWSQRSGSMQQNRGHWQVNIVAEIRCAAKPAKPKPRSSVELAQPGYLLFAAISMLLSFSLSPSTVPFTVT